MNNILSEKEYQAELLHILENQNGYTLDRKMLMDFLNDTQSEAMEKLKKIHKERLEETLVAFINNECTKKRGSLIEILRHGIEISGVKLDLMYTKPTTIFNKDLLDKYTKNRFSVMEEVYANDKERIDIVIFLNGFAIISIELKCNFAGWSVNDAIYQ